MSKGILKTRKSINSAILTSAGTGLAANPARTSYFVQNLGTNPLFVKEGTGASTTDFTFILAAGTGADNGTGGSKESISGQVYTGAVTFAGTTPRCIFTERIEELNS